MGQESDEDFPSPASECSVNNIRISWLVEDRRPALTIRYSGTMRHPNHNDRTGATVVAFSHFVYEFSNKTLVFADLQGMFPNVMNLNLSQTIADCQSGSIRYAHADR